MWQIVAFNTIAYMITKHPSGVIGQLPQCALDNPLDLLHNFHTSPNTIKLRERFLSPSLFDIIQKDRSETVHSNFLKWLFDLQISNESAGFNIISSLLQFAHKRAVEQGLDFPSDLALAAYGKPESIGVTAEANREYPCPGVIYLKNGKPQTGTVDLVVNGVAKNKKEELIPFKIIIENKVDSKEHDEQTWKYYTFFEGRTENTPKEISIEEQKYQNPLNEQRIYLYLTIDCAECSCDKYIRVSYQDIMDYIIAPLLTLGDLSPRPRLFLEEYSRALSLPYIDNIGNTKIMATNINDNELLKEFWDANQTLITMSLKALASSTTDPETKAEIETTLNNINIIQAKRKEFTLMIGATPKSVVGLANLVYQVIKELANTQDSATLLGEFNSLGKIYGSKSLLSTNKNNYIDGNGTERHLSASKKRNDIVCQDGVTIYCSNQLTENNVEPFIKFVNSSNYGMSIS